VPVPEAVVFFADVAASESGMIVEKNADFLDLVLAAGRDEVSNDGLGGEQRGPRDAEFGVVPGPFDEVERLDGEFDYELVCGESGPLDGPLDPFPLLGEHADVLVDGPGLTDFSKVLDGA